MIRLPSCMILASLCGWIALVPGSPPQSSLGLTVIGGETITDPDRVDMDLEIRKPRSCVIESTSTTLRQDGDRTPSGFRTDILVFSSNGKTKVVEHAQSGGTESSISCGSTLGYYVHPFLGMVFAYDGTGKEQWRSRLSPFTPADLESVAQARSSIREEGRAWVTRIQARGDYLLVEWRIRGAGYQHRLYNARGEILDQVGPWDTLLINGTDAESWTAVAGGGIEWRFYTPQELLELGVGDLTSSARSELDRRIVEATERIAEKKGLFRKPSVVELDAPGPLRHALAFLTPRPSSSNFRLSFCPQTPLDETRFWLRNDYAEDDARIAREAVLRLLGQIGGNGPITDATLSSWIRNRAKGSELASVIQQYEPGRDDWVARYQRLLLEEIGNELQGSIDVLARSSSN